jgi:SAM-dependent methyltransferase
MALDNTGNEISRRLLWYRTKVSYWIRDRLRPPVLKNGGFCPTCLRKTRFVAREPWLRDHYVCEACGSIPRERALMLATERFAPNWRELTIHESSPGNRGASMRLAAECTRYIPSQFFPGQQAGSIVGKHRCENLEAMSFADQSIDIHVTQDVLEHVFEPARAFQEIARTLRPGGMHIFTVPLVTKERPSRVRAQMVGGQVVYLEPAQYHGNPVGDGRALVTMDWGYDICRYIFDNSGLYTHIVHIDDLSHGVRAELLEVLVTVKPLQEERVSGLPASPASGPDQGTVDSRPGEQLS